MWQSVQLIEELAEAAKAGDEKAVDGLVTLLSFSWPIRITDTITADEENFDLPRTGRDALLWKFVEAVEDHKPLDTDVLDYIAHGVRRFLEGKNSPWPATQGDSEKCAQQREIRGLIRYLYYVFTQGDGLPHNEAVKRIQEQNFTADGQGVALEEKTISNALKEGDDRDKAREAYEEFRNVQLKQGNSVYPGGFERFYRDHWKRGRKSKKSKS